MIGERGDTTTERYAERREQERPRTRFAPGDMLRRVRCGLALYAAHDRTRAGPVSRVPSPRCDGRLPTREPSAHPRQPLTRTLVQLAVVVGALVAVGLIVAAHPVTGLVLIVAVAGGARRSVRASTCRDQGRDPPRNNVREAEACRG